MDHHALLPFKQPCIVPPPGIATWSIAHRYQCPSPPPLSTSAGLGGCNEVSHAPPMGFASPLLSPAHFGSLGIRVFWFPVWCLMSLAQAGAQLGGFQPRASSSPSHGCVLTTPSAQIYFQAWFVGIKEPDKQYVFNSNVTNECRGSWYQPLSKSRGGMSIICLLPASLNWLSFRAGKKPNHCYPGNSEIYLLSATGQNAQICYSQQADFTFSDGSVSSIIHICFLVE